MVQPVVFYGGTSRSVQGPAGYDSPETAGRAQLGSWSSSHFPSERKDAVEVQRKHVQRLEYSASRDSGPQNFVRLVAARFHEGYLDCKYWPGWS